MRDAQEQCKKGRGILYSLLVFFAVFASVDAFFVYKAVTTHTGVITENAYEKGLAYNKTIEQAKRQEGMNVFASYEEGVLVVKLKDTQGVPILNAVVTADILRDINKDQDFEVLLQHKGSGQYEKTLNLPLKGIWTANINARWKQKKKKNNMSYQTALPIKNQ